MQLEEAKMDNLDMKLLGSEDRVVVNLDGDE
jgi:hypothetical protein